METYAQDKLTILISWNKQLFKRTDSEATLNRANIKVKNNIFFQNLTKNILMVIKNYFVDINNANFRAIKTIMKMISLKKPPKSKELIIFRLYMETTVKLIIT
jgi:hypothetical protein